jgi:transcriptional regulator with XRE-family HTH domain
MSENFLPGTQLSQLRSQKGFSLKELASRAGTSPSALHRYESGWGAFELKTLARLAAALGARLEIRLHPALSPEPVTLTARQLANQWSRLFWDVNLTRGHLEANGDWVLRRVLQFGNWDDVHRARLYFGHGAIRRAANHRSMDARTKHFWHVVLGSGNEHR